MYIFIGKEISNNIISKTNSTTILVQLAILTKACYKSFYLENTMKGYQVVVKTQTSIEKPTWNNA